MLIAQITDLHIAREDEVTPDGFNPAGDLVRMVEAVNAFDPLPDFVIVTGDLVDKRTHEEYHVARRLLDPLKMPAYIVPGNHDARGPLTDVFDDHDYLTIDGTYLHYALDWGPLRLIGLDSLGDGAVGGVMDAPRLQWLSDRLSEAPETPTFIFMHHPPFRTGIREFDNYGFEGLDEFRHVIEGAPQVERIVCGHIHRSIVTRLGRATVSVCPSTTYAFPASLRPDAPRLGRQQDAPGFQIHMRGLDEQWITHHIMVPR